MTSGPSAADLPTLRAAQAGDPAAWDRLARRHAAWIHRQARRWHWPGADRDDVAQEAWVGWCQAVRSWRPQAAAPDGVAAFFALCVRRQLQSALRRATRPSQAALCWSLDAPDASGTPWVAQWPDPQDGFRLWEQAEALRSAWPRLSALEQTVVLARAAGWPLATVAARLGRPVKTVDNALQRGRRKLRATRHAE